MSNSGGDLDNKTVAVGDLEDGYQPDPSVTIVSTGETASVFDASRRLEIHGSVTSDEGGFRDDFAGVALTAEWTPANSGTGSSVSVASGRVSILPGTTNGGNASIFRAGDYLPMTLQFYGRISQRIANQTTVFGFQDSGAIKQAVIVLDGTVNTTLKFRTSWGSAATEIQESTVTLPAGQTTATDQKYVISVSANLASLIINDVLVAKHALHIPGPYDAMDVVAKVTNSAVVTATTLSFDAIYLNNWDRTQVDNDFVAEPLLVSQYVDNSSGVNSVNRTELSQQAIQGLAFAYTNNTLVANSAETRLIYFVNSSANSKTLYIGNMLLTVDPNSANWVTYYIYQNPTVTANGTLQTLPNLKPNAGISSVASLYVTPTVTANGTRIYILPVANSNQAGSTFPREINPYVIIPPGSSILINGIAKANNTPLIIDINWFEAT